MIRALLYKDILVLWKYSKFLLMIMIPFLIFGATQPDNSFFAIYPAVAICTLGINSLSYDERFGWTRYAAALPYSRRELVTAKYLLSLLGLACAMVLYFASAVVYGVIGGTLGSWDFLWGLQTLLLIATVYTAVMLPFAFRFGLEKARIIYIIAICGTVGVTMSLPRAGLAMPDGVTAGALTLGLLVLCAGLWAVSWYISVRIYRNKEL